MRLTNRSSYLGHGVKVHDKLNMDLYSIKLDKTTRCYETHAGNKTLKKKKPISQLGHCIEWVHESET